MLSAGLVEKLQFQIYFDMIEDSMAVLATHKYDSKTHDREDDFVFVCMSHPTEIKNRDNQRAIRSRAMRDIGRSRRTRKRRPIQVTFGLEKTVFREEKSLSALQSPIPVSLTSWPFPVELDLRAKELINFMNSESDSVHRPFRSVWFSMALVDQSAFKLSLANASMFLAQRTDPCGFRYENCIETLKYFGQCLSLITKRLEDPKDRVSEGVITTILGLVCHDLYVGIWDRLEVHNAGLYLLYKLRGGFTGLNPNVPLFATWYDVLACAMKDKSPSFPNYTLSHALSLGYTKLPLLEAMIQQLQEKVGLGIVAQALERLAAVAHFVNTVPNTGNQWRKEDDMTPLYLMGSLAHTLLSMPRIDLTENYISPTNFLQELTRLAMLILLAKVKKEYHFTSTELRLLEYKFLRLMCTSSDNRGKILPHLQLWAFLTVATLQSQLTTQEICTSEIRILMDSLGIKSTKSAFEMAKGIIWMGSIAGAEPSELLVRAIERMP